MDRKAFLESCKSLEIELSDAQVESFEEFEDDLYEANAVMNLTRVPREECYIRHFLDSLMLGKVIEELNPAGQVLDIGTGPGFPAWCLACAFPKMKVTGLDSNGKMLGFMQRHLRENLTSELARAEESTTRGMYDIVTGRAVAPLTIQLEISAAPMKLGGYVVPMRTPQDDLTNPNWRKLGLDLVEVKEMLLPGTEIVRIFPIFMKAKVTPKEYPRRWGDIKKRPL